MSNIIQTIQKIVQREMNQVRVAELGLVEEVYPHASADDNDNYGCDVRLKNSGLLLKRVPVATGHIGTVAIPNLGDLVLLTFENGDINQPLITGRLYNNEDRPPLNNPNEVIFRLPLDEPDEKTVMAAIRNLDNDPPREVLLQMPPKITLQINDGMVHTVAGKTEVKLDQSKSSGTVTVLAGSTVITVNQDGDVTVDASGSISLQAKGDITLKGTNINLESTANTQIKAGAKATLKGRAGADVDGGPMAGLKGAAVNIKGFTTFSP